MHDVANGALYNRDNTQNSGCLHKASVFIKAFSVGPRPTSRSMGSNVFLIELHPGR